VALGKEAGGNEKRSQPLWSSRLRGLAMRKSRENGIMLKNKSGIQQ
jgi:hypothetical protein